MRADVESVKKRRGVGDISRKRAARDDPRDTNGARRIRISDKTPPRRQLASVRAVVGFAARCATRRVRRISSAWSAERDEDAGRAANRARRVGSSPGGKRHVSRSPRGIKIPKWRKLRFFRFVAQKSNNEVETPRTLHSHARAQTNRRFDPLETLPRCLSRMISRCRDTSGCTPLRCLPSPTCAFPASASPKIRNAFARNRRARTRIADSAARHPAADPPAIRDRAASGDPAASVSSRTGPNLWATA